MPTTAAAPKVGVPHWKGVGTRNQGAAARLSVLTWAGWPAGNHPAPVPSQAAIHATTMARRIGKSSNTRWLRRRY